MSVLWFRFLNRITVSISEGDTCFQNKTCSRDLISVSTLTETDYRTLQSTARLKTPATNIERSVVSRPCLAHARGFLAWFQPGPPPPGPGDACAPHPPAARRAQPSLSFCSEHKGLSGSAYLCTRETDRQIFKKGCMSLILVDVKTFLFSKTKPVG